jgi:CRISPR system Cascade subunit CasE
MYFSLISPAPGRERDAAHARALGPYEEHQWLWQFFPRQPEANRDFLFRHREIEGASHYYLVSERRPTSPETAWHVKTRDYAPELDSGACLHFDLRANPIVTSKRDGKACRDDVVMAEKKRLLQERGLKNWSEWRGADKPQLYDLVDRTCRRWLIRRAETHGFLVDEDALRVDGYLMHSERRHLPKTRQLRFSTVDFSGVLTVTDADRVAICARRCRCGDAQL